MAIIGFSFIGVALLSISFDPDVTVFGDSGTEDEDEDHWWDDPSNRNYQPGIVEYEADDGSTVFSRKY
jgi:hypothetical protein